MYSGASFFLSSSIEFQTKSWMSSIMSYERPYHDEYAASRSELRSQATLGGISSLVGDNKRTYACCSFFFCFCYISMPPCSIQFNSNRVFFHCTLSTSRDLLFRSISGEPLRLFPSKNLRAVSISSFLIAISRFKLVLHMPSRCRRVAPIPYIQNTIQFQSFPTRDSSTATWRCLWHACSLHQIQCNSSYNQFCGALPNTHTAMRHANA